MHTIAQHVKDKTYLPSNTTQGNATHTKEKHINEQTETSQGRTNCHQATPNLRTPIDAN